MSRSRRAKRVIACASGLLVGSVLAAVIGVGGGHAAALPPRTPEAMSSALTCGVERWPVKTLSDADAGSVNFAPIQATVSQLRALPAPASLPQSFRIGPTELTTYTVTANVTKFKLEDDRDIHVVITDLSDAAQTMIVEFPDAVNCDGASTSTHAGEMIAARSALIAAYGTPSSSSFKSISGVATFTGVGFFDFKHGQTGVAPNAIELHPVLSFMTGVAPAAPPSSCTVQGVFDGNTFTCTDGAQVRMLQIAAQDLGACGGGWARAALEFIFLRPGTVARLDYDVTPIDAGGRLLAAPVVTGTDGADYNISIVMIYVGLARAAQFDTNTKFLEWANAAQVWAATAQWNMWAPEGPFRGATNC